MVETVWDAISIYDGPQPFLQQFSNAEEAPRTLFAAHWCQSEVRNGGLYQFFWNSTAVLAPEAVDAYRTIEMPKLAAVVSEAMRWFGPTYPRDTSVRRRALERYKTLNSEKWDPFDALDHQFYGCIESENGGFEAAADSYANRFVEG